MKQPFQTIQAKKHRGERIVSLTAYDYASARILDGCGLDFVLVGDSLGMVFAGLPDTTGVTMEHMCYHTEVVRRGLEQTPLVADLPFRSYENEGEAERNALRLLEAGADAVKLEGGTTQKAIVAHLCSQGIPLMGHIGMLPQRIHEEGGYRKKGRSQEDAERLLRSAADLVDAGAGAMVLEGVVPTVATRITEAVPVPTIGIGAGGHCDGQIRVLHDLTGASPWFRPPFAAAHADFGGDLQRAVDAFRTEIEEAANA